MQQNPGGTKLRMEIFQVVNIDRAKISVLFSLEFFSQFSILTKMEEIYCLFVFGATCFFKRIQTDYHLFGENPVSNTNFQYI